jgi:general secretion pathway protein N
MMRWPVVTALAIAGYLFFLLYSLPAQQVAGWLGDNNQSTLTLRGINGTIWSGEAEHAYYQARPLGQIEWHFKPSRLFLGKLAYDIELQQTGQQLQGTLLAGLGNSVRLEAVDALLLASQVPAWLQQRQMRLDGKIRAQQLDLAFTDGRLTAAEGTLQWLEGSVLSPLNLALGDLQADLTTDEDTGDITAELRDLKGAIAIQGEARLKVDGNFQVKGKLKPGDKADPGIASALRAFGRPQPDGSIQLNYAGRM